MKGLVPLTVRLNVPNGTDVGPLGRAVTVCAAPRKAIVIDAPSTAAVQEIQLVAIHAMCAAMDDVLTARGLMKAGPTCRQGS